MNTSSDPQPEHEPSPSAPTTGDEPESLSPEEDVVADEYEEQADQPDTEKRVHVPPVVVWAVVALLSFACASVFLLSLTQSTWDIGNISHIDLSRCIPALRDRLATTTAPAAVLQRLTTAAQPGIWKSEAYAALREAQQMLAPLQNDPVIAAVLDELRLMLPDNQYGYLGCGYRRLRTGDDRTQISPTLRPIP